MIYKHALENVDAQNPLSREFCGRGLLGVSREIFRYERVLETHSLSYSPPPGSLVEQTDPWSQVYDFLEALRCAGLEAEADQFIAREDFNQLALQLQVTTPNKCLHCKQSTIWLVTDYIHNPCLWMDRIIQAGEQRLRFRFRDAPKVCPCEQCRMAVNRSKGVTTWARANVNAETKQKVMGCLRQNRDEFEVHSHLNKRRRKKQDPVKFRRRKQRQQLKAAKAAQLPIYRRQDGSKYVMSLPGLDNLQASGCYSGLLSNRIYAELEIPLCAALPNCLSPRGTRNQVEDWALDFLSSQPSSLGIHAQPLEPAEHLHERLTLHGHLSTRIDDIGVAHYSDLDDPASMDEAFTFNVKGARHFRRDLQHLSKSKLPIAKRLQLLNRLRKSLCTQLLDELLYKFGLDTAESAFPQEYWLTLTSIHYLRKSRAEFQHYLDLKKYLNRESQNYIEYLRKLLTVIFPQESALLNLTVTLAADDLARSPRHDFTSYQQLADFLRGHLQRAKVALRYDGRLSALHVRLLAMPAFQHYRKSLPPAFQRTKIARPPYQAPVNWAVKC